MTLPKTVRIVNTLYKITYYETPFDVAGGTGNLYNGSIDNNDCTIKILVKDRSNNVIASDILHEVLHGLSSMFSVGAMHDDEHEEDNIERLTHGLHQVLQDNPVLVELLTEKEST